MGIEPTHRILYGSTVLKTGRHTRYLSASIVYKAMIILFSALPIRGFRFDKKWKIIYNHKIFYI